jgi:hypothetical protein
VSTFEFQPGGAAPLSSTDRGVGPQTSFDGHIEHFSPPRRLAVEELPAIVDDFRKAARNAIDAGTFKVHLPDRLACMLCNYSEYSASALFSSTSISVISYIFFVHWKNSFRFHIVINNVYI